MSTSKIIRFGILGPGNIARKFAADIQLVPNAKLVAVASRNIKKAQNFMEEFDAEIAYGSYQELAESDKVDAIYIATPHNFHYSQARLMLEHKKHVLCEKPITVNSYELNDLIKVAKENNVLLMEAFWTRFLPATKYVKKVIEGETLGKLRNMTFRFGFEVSEDYPETGRLLNPDLAGGSILDLGIYPVGISRFFDDSEVVHMDVESRLSYTGIDLDTLVEITFESGVNAICHSSLSQDLDLTGHLEFDNGDIYMKDFFHSQEVIINDKSIEIPYRGDGFVDQIESFSNTVIEGLAENSVMTHDVMKDVIGLLDKIRLEAGALFEFEKRESE